MGKSSDNIPHLPELWERWMPVSDTEDKRSCHVFMRAGEVASGMKGCDAGFCLSARTEWTRLESKRLSNDDDKDDDLGSVGTGGHRT